MINCFRLTKRLYWFVLVPLFVAVMIAMIFLTENDILSLVVGFLVFFIGSRLLGRLALKKYTEKNRVLDEKCDSVSYRDWQCEMMSRNLKGVYRILVQLNLATACYYCGDFRQMKSTLEEIDISRINQRAITYLFSYYRLWFLYHNTLSNMCEAEKALEQIDSLPLPSDEKQNIHCEYIVRMSHLTLECQKSQIPYLEEKIKMLRTSDKLLSIVCEKNFLGKYYLRNGMKDKAKECFEFVAEHGNTLFIARAAKEILEEI